jgi:Helix-turn-helix domain of transposase family ISL3/Transposase
MTATSARCEIYRVSSFGRVWSCIGVRCPDCEVKTEKVPQLPSKAPFSKRFEEAVGLACESAAVRRVARQFGMASSTVRAIDVRYLSRWSEGRRKPALRRMGGDEIYLGKKQKFFTVVSNLETREPLWFGRERKKPTLDEFFEEPLSAFQGKEIVVRERHQRPQVQDCGTKWRVCYWDYGSKKRSRRTKSSAKSLVPTRTDAQRLADEFMESVNQRNDQPQLFPGGEETLAGVVAICRDKMWPTWHPLRHACTSLLDAVGTPRGTVTALVGHSSPRMTEHYVHSLPAGAREAVQKVEDLLTGPKRTQIEEIRNLGSALIQ